MPAARELVAALVARAREHRDTLCVGRTHGVHAEPTTFGIKLAGFAIEAAPQRSSGWSAAFTQASVGALSGAVGTYSATDPAFEVRVLARLGLAASRSPPRSSRATATPSCCRRSRSPAPGSSGSPPRSATCSAPR